MWRLKVSMVVTGVVVERRTKMMPTSSIRCGSCNVTEDNWRCLHQAQMA